MIPYFTIPGWHLLGPITIQPFGILVLLGILVGNWFAHRRAKGAGVPQDEITGAVRWALISGLIVSHIHDLLLNHPELLRERGPLVVLEFWNGMSSFGGLIGALAGVTAYFAFLKKSWLRHADILLQALVVGWIFGRLGCTIVHDHIGLPTTFFLAFKYPWGASHNLGFYEFLFTLLVLFPAILLLHRVRAKPGMYTATLCLLYAPFRFFLEFLRPDVRYFFGLDFAQFCSIGLLGLGIWTYFRVASRDPDEPQKYSL